MARNDSSGGRGFRRSVSNRFGAEAVRMAALRALLGDRFVPEGVSRANQIHAAIVLPAFIIISIVLAKVTHTLILDLMPDGIAAVSALRAVLGALLVIATGMAWILWVRTGGFGIFE